MRAKVEYLKHVVQEVMSAFQEGAGLANGRPEPMTYGLAVQRIWMEIDRAFNTDLDDPVSNFVTMRVQGKRPLHEILELLYSVGSWHVRGTAWRVDDGTVVLHVSGQPSGSVITLLGTLASKDLEVTDFTVGLSNSVS